MYRFKPKNITHLREATEGRYGVAPRPESLPRATEPPPPFRLRIEHASGAFEIMTSAFAQESVFIGRAVTNAVRLSNPMCMVSRQHAEIRWEAGCFWLIDVGSKNATLLNGQRLEAHRPYALQHGDRFQVGDYRIDFILEVALAYPLAS